jgi:DNA-binding IclR family transcriptional regulator
MKHAELQARVLHALNDEGGEGLADYQIARRVGLVNSQATRKVLVAFQAEGLVTSQKVDRTVFWWRACVRRKCE